MRPYVLLLALATGCPKSTPPVEVLEEVAKQVTDEDASAELFAFFERVHAEGLAVNPSFAAYLGLPHDDTQWTPAGRAHQEHVLSLYRRWLDELDALSTTGLSPSELLSMELYRDGLKQRIERDRWWNYGYTFTQISGPHTRIPSFLMRVHRIEDEATAESWIARVKNAAPLLDQILGEVAIQEELGILPPAYTYPKMLGAIDRLTTGAPFGPGEPTPLLAHFTDKVDALELDEARKTELKAAAATALKDHLGPAYHRVRDVLAAQAEAVTENRGAWSLPDGADYYASNLKEVTTTDLTADEIHEIGLSEMARIQDEMRALMPALGVEGDLQDLYDHFRDSDAYTLPNTDEGRESYLALARGYVAGMDAVLPESFEQLPEQPLEVRRVETWRENGAGKAFYNGPAPDGSRPGIFYVNLADMADMPTYQLEALVYHEGAPGHHLQIATAQGLDDLPPFRRFDAHYTAYTEGWGLYSELFPKEVGFYEDPASDFGRLAMELWRAARLVVDTGMHHKQWTREQAIDYLVTETPNPKGDCVAAIERYMVWPGQATAYKIGMIEILRMREQARDQLGDAFDIRAFHGLVLGLGPVPLHVLDKQVRAWVDAQLAEASASP